MTASKAARIFTAAQGRQVVDFSARRAHGGEASLLSARASVIGGCVGTLNTLAGQQFGLATYGTQAHSWVMAHEDEGKAFASFLDAVLVGVHPNRAADRTEAGRTTARPRQRST